MHNSIQIKDLLENNADMTLRGLADIAYTLGYKVEVELTDKDKQAERRPLHETYEGVM